MSKGYITSRVLLTVLLSFLMAGYILLSSADAVLSLPSIYTNIIKDEDLADKAYAAIEEDFKSQYNTTAVPPEVYMEAISTDWLEAEMCSRTEMYLDYIDGTETDYQTDFAKLEESITTFFHEYAESIDYTPDEAFDKKLDETITRAETTIESRMDAFYMDSLHEKGYLDKLRKYVPYIGRFSWITFAAVLIFMWLFVFIERMQDKARRLYWSGVGFFCGGALTAIPSVYLLCTGAVKNFAVTDPIIYTAVTELLDASILRVIIKSVIFIVLGVAVIVLNEVLYKKANAK